MVIRVSVIGYDRIGKRIADAVTRQHDMVVQGVCEDDPYRRSLAMHNGLELLSAGSDQAHADADIAIVCREDCHASSIPLVYAAHLRSSGGVLYPACSSTVELFSRPCIRILPPDAIALGRIAMAVAPLARIERLFVNTIVRAAHATQSNAGLIDSLEPLPDDEMMNRKFSEAFGGVVPNFQIRQVRASYSHSHLHTVQLDLEHVLDRQEVLAAFSNASRILLGAASNGFATTADVQEFFRNSTRRRGDRPEIFVWEESVIVNQRRLFLMMDVCQEATSIPDTIDAIRLRQDRCSDPLVAIRHTDASLNLGCFWQTAVEKRVVGCQS